MGHTKWPWVARRWWEQAGLDIQLCDEEEREHMLSAPYMDIYSEIAGKTVTACHDLSKMTAEDAALLSAAPELLEALEILADWVEECCSDKVDSDNFVAASRAAIARAKGGQ